VSDVIKVYKIKAKSREHYEEVFYKLIAVGFVFGSNRFRKIEEVNEAENRYREYRGHVWDFYPVIYVNAIRDEDNGCKMVLHCGAGQCMYIIGAYIDITVEEFLEKVFPRW